MISKIQNHHREKSAYIYLRQSTMGQVRHHQESTERQYALKERALELGWTPGMIRVIDSDLGISGTQMGNRQGFRTLVAEVSLKQVGAVFALEASRLSRSNTDWHRLIELCSITDTLIIDEDGCYNPADFNDQLLLGLKGTMSQAELHFLRTRLLGGKTNKAKKEKLRFPLPVGFCYDEEDNIVLDPDEEVRGVVELLFSTFRQTGSAYSVVHKFAKSNIKFPKRSYGGIWNGRLIWGQLTHGRVLGILKNPSYAGVYVYGRYKYAKKKLSDGNIANKVERMPMDSWQVTIKDHHKGYISWDEFLDNQKIFVQNQTNGEETLLSGSAREGLALLGQGGLPQLIAHLSIRVAADTPPLLSYPLASLCNRVLPSPKIDRLGQWKLNFYEATFTFTLVTTRIFARQSYTDFVDGLQKAMFPPPPAIQATWLWLLP